MKITKIKIRTRDANGNEILSGPFDLQIGDEQVLIDKSADVKEGTLEDTVTNSDIDSLFSATQA